jgi:tetratricopeptide (TPR) repeat protein
MKSFFLVLLIQTALAQVPIRTDSGNNTLATEGLYSRRGELAPPPEMLGFEELNAGLISDLRLHGEDLKKIKYYLLNGETRLAKLHLGRLAYKKTKLRPIVYRYLGILSFIESDFASSLDYFSRPELRDSPHFGKICTLKVLNQIVLSKKHDLEKDWARCQLENFRNFREENLVWLETLVNLKLSPRKGVTEVPFQKMRLAALTPNELKIMLKLSLYLNQERVVESELNDLTMDQLQDTEVRELVGQIFFRSGAFAKAYRFVEDLKSPNSENIKGNLYVLRNKYELAYAQFKLALEEKQNSQNAIERLLPLAWLLGDWEGGAKYAEQAIASPQTLINKLTVLAAFQMQKGAYQEAEKVLNVISQKSRRGTEIDVTQLASFTALMQNHPLKVKKEALLSCEQYDLVNCWILFQMGQWETFPLMVRREDKIPEGKLWEKLSKTAQQDPLKENVFINQLDIEELDDKLIQLIPKS